MVLPAVLRDPARDPRQADGCDRARRLDLDPGLPPLARHVTSPFRALSAAVQAVLLAVRDRVHRAWLARFEAAGGHLRHPRAHLHHLLFCVLPGHPAAARHLREDQAGAEFNFRTSAGREGVSGRYVSYWPKTAEAGHTRLEGCTLRLRTIDRIAFLFLKGRIRQKIDCRYCFIPGYKTFAKITQEIVRTCFWPLLNDMTARLCKFLLHLKARKCVYNVGHL